MCIGESNCTKQTIAQDERNEEEASSRHQNTIRNQYMVLTRVRKATNEGMISTKRLVVMKATLPRITKEHHWRTSHDQLTAHPRINREYSRRTLHASLMEIERDTRDGPRSILHTSTYTNKITYDSLGKLYDFRRAHAIYLCDKSMTARSYPLKGTN